MLKPDNTMVSPLQPHIGTIDANFVSQKPVATVAALRLLPTESQPALRPLSLYQVEVIPTDQCQLKELLQLYASGCDDPQLCREIQLKIAALLDCLDKMDIWYNPTTNRLLGCMEELRGLTAGSCQQFVQKSQWRVTKLVASLDDIQGALLRTLTPESEPVFRELLKSGFSPPDKLLDYIWRYGRRTIPADLFTRLFSDRTEDTTNADIGIKLLTFSPDTFFWEWYNRSVDRLGQDVCHERLLSAFWKDWQSEITLRMYSENMSDAVAIFVWRSIVVPLVNEAVAEGAFPAFISGQPNDITEVLSQNESLFTLLLSFRRVCGGEVNFMRELPDIVHPWLLWAMAKKGKYRVVSSVVSVFPHYRNLLLETDSKTGENLLHFFDGYVSERGDKFKKMVQQLQLESLFRMANNDGDAPLSTFQPTQLQVLEGNYQAVVEFVHFVLMCSDRKAVNSFVSECLNYQSAELHPLFFAVLVMQVGCSPELCQISVNKLKHYCDGHLWLERVHPLLARYIPLKTCDIQPFVAELMDSGLPAAALLDIAFALPADLAQRVLECCCSTPYVSRFLGGFINTGLFPLGAEWDQKYPWTDLLLLAGYCFKSPEMDADLGRRYQQLLASSVTNCAGKMERLPVDVVNEFLDPRQHKEVYGRTICSESESGRRFYLKLRKRFASSREEPLHELTREQGVLTFLREQQALFKETAGSRGMDIRSHLPRPEGNFVVSERDELLGLPEAKRGNLSVSTAVEDDGNGIASYLFSTEKEQLYHRYVHQNGGMSGITLDCSLRGLRVAAHDIGVLFRHGFSVENLLPMYHSHSQCDTRQYQALNQFLGYKSQGCLMDWNGRSTEYPNISPWPTVLRDFAEIRPHHELTPDSKLSSDDLSALMVLGNNMLGLELLLARTMQQSFCSRDPDQFAVTVKVIREELLTLYTTLFGEAFAMPENSAERTRLRKILETGGVTDQAAREMVYWCEGGGNPEWVYDVRCKRIPDWVYPQRDIATFEHIYEEDDLCLLKPSGFMNSTANPDQTLGSNNGWILLTQSNCMKTLAIVAALTQQEVGGSGVASNSDST